MNENGKISFNYPGKKRPLMIHALIPIIVLMVILALNVYYFKDAVLDGPNQMALLLASIIGVLISFRLGVGWEHIMKHILDTINKAMPSILILFLIGALSGSWLISGVVPTLIYYGLDILHPSIFLFATVIISGIVALATGSSWSTIATIGVALLGIGITMGIEKPIIAGAIISGAYFGDKMSPLSDTTNLAPAMAGTDLFTHVKYMIYTTWPTMVITLIIFFVIGFHYDFNVVIKSGAQVQHDISTQFYISPILMLVPIILATVIILKVPPIPALTIGVLLGICAAVIFQPQILKQIAGVDGSYAKITYISSMKALYGSVQIETGDKAVDGLFRTSGMSGMLPTIWLIITAMIFGGVMEASGLLMRIGESIINYAKNTGSLVASTVATCIFINITASYQYISIVIPGRMFADTYKDMNLKPEVLSRTLEDAGTVTSVLVPWSTGGATQARVLGVSTLSYLPYCFFNLISPFMTIFFAYAGIKIRKIIDEKKENNK